MFSAILSCLNSGLYITSRTLRGLAASGDAPGLFGRVDRRGVPGIAILCSSLCGLAVSLCSALSPGGVFAFVTSATGAVMLLVYGMIVTSHMQTRRLAAGHPAFSARLGNGAAVTVLAGMLLVTSAMLTRPDQRHVVVSSLGCAIFFAICAALRRLRRSSGGMRVDDAPCSR